MGPEYPHLAELRELVALSELEPTGMHDLFEDLRLLTDAGLPVVRAEIDCSSAVPTDGFKFVHKLSDLLLVRLAALRARHINSGEVKSGICTHSLSPQVYNCRETIEVMPEVIEEVISALFRFTRDENEIEVATNLARMVLFLSRQKETTPA
jgi:hypothetical protein